MRRRGELKLQREKEKLQPKREHEFQGIDYTSNTIIEEQWHGFLGEGLHEF